MMRVRFGTCLGLVMAVGLAVSTGAGADAEVTVTDDSFGCVTDLTPVRHFYVDNLLGDLAASLAVANSETGGVYPVGTVIQLKPDEAMIKREKGFSEASRDWEFFTLDLSAEGTHIRDRGPEDVVNRSGMNCLSCHERAEPKWDLMCETGHGCAPLKVTGAQIAALQAADPRCKPAKSD